MDNGKKYLTPTELVERWDGAIGKGTLANWRAQGRGPGYVKIGGRVLYPVEAVAEYEQQNRRGAA